MLSKMKMLPKFIVNPVIFFFTLTLVGFSFNAVAKDALNIQSVSFPKGSSVSRKVRAECKLIQKTGKFLNKYAKKHFDPVTTTKKPVKGAYNLSVKIVSTSGGPGGTLTGAKGVYMEGSLTKNKKKIGSFKALRRSGGGVTFGYKGTCSILGRSVKRLARDITDWAANPALNSKIGELR